jgi:hypothetical protein
MLLQNIWDNGEEANILSYDTSSREVKVTTNVYFSQVLCRFVGELDMKIGTGSSVNPIMTTSISGSN